MTALLLLVLSLPCVYWTAGVENRATLEAAGITRLCTEADLAQREALPTPGTTARAFRLATCLPIFSAAQPITALRLFTMPIPAPFVRPKRTRA